MSSHPPQEKTFKLKIDFMCLCFFVPDEANGRMHVLMPATCSHAAGTGQVEEHRVSLMYPMPGGSLDALGHEVGPGQGVNAYEDIKGYRLVLGEGEQPAVLDLGAEVPDVSRAAGPVNPALLDHPGGKVAAHVVLASGAREGNYAAARWTFDGKTGPIAQRVVWEMTLPGDSLTWRLTSLADGSERALPDIPVPANRVVKIEIHHTTPECFPIPVTLAAQDTDTIAQHFSAFYTLCGSGQSTPAVPTFEGVDEDLPMRCMTGGGTLSS